MDRRTAELPTVVRTGLFASSGVVVACALQPLDVVKIRLQTGVGGYRGAMHCAYRIAAHEGFYGLYAGTSAALLRHAVHAVAWVTAHSIFISTITKEPAIGAAQRLLNGRGTLANMANIFGFHLQVHWPGQLYEQGLLRGFLYGAAVGALAAIVSNPAEEVRGQHFGRKEPAIGAVQRLLNGRGTLANMANMANIFGFHLQVHWPGQLYEQGLLRGFFYGAAVGALAAIVSNPAEVAMVRMATDGMMRKRQRKYYRHVVDAIRHIKEDEGWKGLWSGSFHSVLRTVLSLGVSVPFYATVRSTLVNSGMPPDSATLHFYCSAATGLVSSVVTLPSDFAKTRIQCSDQSKCHTESAVRLLRQMTFLQAFRAVFSGLPPYAEKCLLQAALAAVCYDHLADVYRWIKRTRAPPGHKS